MGVVRECRITNRYRDTRKAGPALESGTHRGGVADIEDAHRAGVIGFAVTPGRDRAAHVVDRPGQRGQHKVFETAERPAGRVAATPVELDLRREPRDQLRAVPQCPGSLTSP